MANNAISPHGTLLAMEKDGDAAGTFTTIAELNDEISGGGMSRPESESTPHNKGIDYWVFGVLRREPITFSINFVFDDGTHDHLTGLKKRIQDGDEFGIRLRGPSGSAGTDELIASGAITNFANVAHPAREGVRTASVTFRPSGPMIVDNVTIGD